MNTDTKIILAMATFSFPVRNYDPAVKAKAEAEAEAEAKWATEITGQRHVVTYYDDYNDYSVSGRYVVKPA